MSTALASPCFQGRSSAAVQADGRITARQGLSWAIHASERRSIHCSTRGSCNEQPTKMTGCR